MKYNPPRILTLVFYFFAGPVLVALLSSCGSSTDAVPELVLEGHWQLEGLADTTVRVLEPDPEGLLVGTEQGLFRWSEGERLNLGLNGREVRGVVRLRGGELLAAAVPDPADWSAGDTTLFLLSDEGKTWEPFLNNFGGEEGGTFIHGLKSLNQFSDTLFAKGPSERITARSTDGGETWKSVLGRWDSWGGSGTFVKADSYHPGYIWVGGETALFQPSLWKSTDEGKNWKWLGESLREVEGTIVEAVAYDVVPHPEDPDRVLVGMSGGTRKTTDGGKSWRVVLDSTGVHAFARSRDNPEVIYASGRDPSTKLFFATTVDFGETWQKVIFEEGPSMVTTNDLAVLKTNGWEVLFLGTDKGLFSFTFEQ